jgi:hypothetical protein
MELQFDPPHAVEFWHDGDRHVEELIELTGDYRVARAAFEEAVKRRLLSAQKTCLPLATSKPPCSVRWGSQPHLRQTCPAPHTKHLRTWR